MNSTFYEISLFIFYLLKELWTALADKVLVKLCKNFIFLKSSSNSLYEFIDSFNKFSISESCTLSHKLENDIHFTSNNEYNI